MMDPGYFNTLFDYSYWARDRVFVALRGMSEAEYAQPNNFSYGSIRGILTHCLDAEFGWHARLLGEQSPEPLNEAQVPTPDSLEQRWRAEEARMRAYLSLLTEDILKGDIVWRGRNGNERRMPNLWLTMAHIVNHATQHRSEAAEALTMVGRSPGDLDLGTYAAERLRK